MSRGFQPRKRSIPCRRFAAYFPVIVLVAALPSEKLPAQNRLKIASTLKRAHDYLEEEITRWQPENQCFSCHHSAAAVRTLLFNPERPTKQSTRVIAAFDANLEFLKSPHIWDNNGPDGEFNDRRLADFHFAMALTDLHQTRRLKAPVAVEKAFDRLVAHQDPLGFWSADETNSTGSPVTLGNELMTAEIATCLSGSSEKRHHSAARRARDWLRRSPARSTLGRAARIRCHSIDEPHREPYLQNQLKLILQAQETGGGWGPFESRPAEVFDTAVVLDTLCRVDHVNHSTLWRAAEFLVREQQDSGFWIESTRPHVRESLAQRIATTAWAVQALQSFRQRIEHSPLRQHD